VVNNSRKQSPTLKGVREVSASGIEQQSAMRRAVWRPCIRADLANNDVVAQASPREINKSRILWSLLRKPGDINGYYTLISWQFHVAEDEAAPWLSLTLEMDAAASIVCFL
jgi:hypothetical protein